MNTTQDRKTDPSDLCTETFACEDIHLIHIQCRVCRIQLVGTPGNTIRVNWQDTTLRRMNVCLQDGVLEVKERDRAAIYEVFGLMELSRDKTLFIELPQGFVGDVQMEGTGELVECRQVTINGNLDIHTNTGRVFLSQTRAAQVNVNAAHGSIHANRIASDDSITLASANGEIICEVCGKTEDYTLFCHSQHGRCRAPNTAHGKKTLRVDSVTGNITASFIEPCK